MKTEPVVSFSHLSQADDEFVGLLGDFAGLGQDVTLSLGNSENPVLSLVVVDADLERSVKETRSDLVGRKVSDVVQGKVDSKSKGNYLTNFFSSR